MSFFNTVYILLFVLLPYSFLKSVMSQLQSQVRDDSSYI